MMPESGSTAATKPPAPLLRETYNRDVVGPNVATINFPRVSMAVPDLDTRRHSGTFGPARAQQRTQQRARQAARQAARMSALLALVALLGALVALAGCKKRAEPGQPAPDFSVTTLDGKQLTLASFRGKVLVLNFWATWCPPCIDEVPGLKALQAEFPNRKVEILAISVDTNPAAVQRFVQTFQLNYAVARDGSWGIAHRYGTKKLPETYIIDPEGNLARKVVSEADWKSPQLRRILSDLTQRG